MCGAQSMWLRVSSEVNLNLARCPRAIALYIKFWLCGGLDCTWWKMWSACFWELSDSKLTRSRFSSSPPISSLHATSAIHGWMCGCADGWMDGWRSSVKRMQLWYSGHLSITRKLGHLIRHTGVMGATLLNKAHGWYPHIIWGQETYVLASLETWPPRLTWCSFPYGDFPRFFFPAVGSNFLVF